MKLGTAVMVLAGVVAGGVMVHHYQHRQRVALDLGFDHLRRIDWSMEHPQVDEYRPFGGEAGTQEEQLSNLRANKTLSALFLKFNLGVMTYKELLVNLQSLANVPIQQAYWRRWGWFRLEEASAGNRKLQAFGGALLKAFGEPLRPESLSEPEAATPQSTAA
ncbi:DUF6082 family protein [Kitasatospora sp. NPDC001095]